MPVKPFQTNIPTVKKLESATAIEKMEPVKKTRMMLRKGYEFDRRGDKSSADIAYHQAIQILEDFQQELGLAVGGNSVGKIAFEHGLSLFRLGRFETACAAFARAVEIWKTLIQFGTCAVAVESLATASSWLALSERKSNLFPQALESYQKSAQLWSQLIPFAPSEAKKLKYTHSLSLTMVGLAKTHFKLGQRKIARQYLEQSRLIAQSIGTARFIASH